MVLLLVLPNFGMLKSGYRLSVSGNWRIIFRFEGEDAIAVNLEDVSRLTVSQILNEHRALTPDMAMRLEKLLGNGAESWLRMQEAVDLWDARQQPERFATIKRLPVMAAA